MDYHESTENYRHFRHSVVFKKMSLGRFQNEKADIKCSKLGYNPDAHSENGMIPCEQSAQNLEVGVC
jgi:hypothetical protein